MANPETEYTKISGEEAVKVLKTCEDKGLSEEEACNRLASVGPNKLLEKKKSRLAKFFGFFWGPIPWMIEIAAILSAVLDKWPDLILILVLLFTNAILGFIQEYKADNAIEALKEKLALKGFVIRDGKWKEISAADLVPGDIIRMKLGDIVPADVKLLSGEYLSIDQSALTGESLPVSKTVNDEAYSGTIIKMGEMVAVITFTGMNTFFGKTAKLVGEANVKSGVQKAVVSIGNFLIFSTLTICLVIFIVTLFRFTETGMSHETAGGIVVFLLVLVIAGIPVALPAVLSVTMAVSATRMAKHKAIVSRLTAIEEMASMNILCADKTGTLTKNEITVADVHAVDGFTDKDVIFYASLASRYHGTDPIDVAIVDNYGNMEELEKHTQTQFVPFDPTTKRTEAHIDDKFVVRKGATHVICEILGVSLDDIKTVISDYADKGMRSLAVSKDDKLVGVIALNDPPRDDTASTVKAIQDEGISMKMITGDRADIAKQIARTINIGTNIIPMSELLKSRNEISMGIEENADGFAEVFPEHKFQIVKSLQGNKHIIGMTGDGVNDAPALKQANVGIAVSNATDAARSAADLILTEPGLSVISRAIEESRRVFRRMKSYAMYRISETIRLLLFLFITILFFNDKPLTPLMIIMIALLNDLPIMMIAYDNMVVERRPMFWRMSEINTVAVTLAVFGVIATFGLYSIGLNVWDLKHDAARTLAFFGMLCGGNLTIYLTRNKEWLLSKPLPEKRFFLATLFSQIAGTLISVYGLGTEEFLGIGWEYVIYSWIYTIAWFGILILVKYAMYKWIYHEDFFSKTPYVQPKDSGSQ